MAGFRGPDTKNRGMGFRGPDMGEYMSGNVLMKALDVLGTANYAAAGTTDALLSGQNPIEGAVEGLRNRMSFIDVLENRGAPKMVALPLGLLGDFVVPTVPGLSLLRGADKVAASKRALLAGRELLEHGRDVNEMRQLARNTPHMLGEVRESGIDLTEQLRQGTAARAAFRNAPEGLGTTAARAAARSVEPLPPTDRGAQVVQQLIREGPEGGSVAPVWLKTANELSERLVRAFRTRMQENPMFRGIGKKFAEMVDERQRLHRELTSEAMTKIENLTKGIAREDWDDIFIILNGTDRGVIDEARKAALAKHTQPIREFLNDHYRRLEELGVHMVARTETMIWKRLGMDGQGVAMRLLKAARQDMAQNGGQLSANASNMLSMTAEGRFLKHLFDHGLKIDDLSGKVMAPIRYNESYVPLMARVRNAGIGHGDHTALAQSIMALDPSILPEEAMNMARRILRDQATEPADVVATFQHSRSGRPIVSHDNVGDFVTDPKAYLTKYAHGAAELEATGTVFGGRKQGYYALRDALANAHGYGSTSTIVGQPRPEFAMALQEMDHAFDILNGDAIDLAAPAIKTMNRISDTLFLGPRTIMIQMTTFMNQAATQGFRNAMTGMVDMVLNPEMRDIVRRGTSALLPGLLDTIDEKSVLEKVSNMNLILKGVGGADRAMRMGAAIGGATALAEHEMKILRLVEAGNVEKAKKLAGYVQRFFGVDASGLLRGERLSNAALWQGAANSAHLTNFTNDLMQLPKAYQSTVGKFFLKFKQYGMQQGMFIHKITKEGFEHGNWGPVLRYAATMPWIYSHVLKGVQQFRSEDKQVDPDSDWKRYVQDLLMLGGFGYIGDLTQAFGSASEGMKLGFIAGPNAGALAKITKAGAYAIPGEGQDLGKSLDLVTPQAVRQMRNLWSNVQE